MPDAPLFDYSQVQKLEIVSPRDTVCFERSSSTQGGKFFVRGTAAGIQSQQIEGHVYILLRPIKPDGGGWFVQQKATVVGDSIWSANAQYGEEEKPPEEGDSFQMMVIATACPEFFDSTFYADPPRLPKESPWPEHAVSNFYHYYVIVRDTCP